MLIEAEQDLTESDGRAHRRRRSWSEEEKRRIVAETLQPGASVSAVARRHDVNANLVFTWRRQFRDEDLGGGDNDAFVPVVVSPAEAMPCASSTAAGEVRELTGEVPAPALGVTGRIEIVLADGRRVIVDKTVNAAALARVVRVLERR